MSIEFLTPMFLVTTQSGEFISCICHYFSFALWHCPGSGGIHRSSNQQHREYTAENSTAKITGLRVKREAWCG